MADKNNDTNAGSALDLSGLGSFDFTPDWAKGKPDSRAAFSRFEPRAEKSGDGRGAQRRDGGGRSGGGFGNGGRSGGGFGGGRQMRPAAGRPEGRPQQRAFVEALKADIRILPVQRELGARMREIQNSHLAYSLKRMAYAFMENHQASIMRIMPKDGEKIEFHQCKACGFVGFSSEELTNHLLAEHLGDYYTGEEIECEPPKGAFTCVAKCGLSGELLGPPNLHGFDARVREMLRTRYPGMREDEYRANIQMVRDPEAVEAWRATAVKKTIYRKKGEEDAPALEREAAEMKFRTTIMPSLTSTPKAVDMKVEDALKTKNLPLLYACRDALHKEQRFPQSIFFALRGAFHHRKLAFFRANDSRGPEFVTAVKASPLDVAHAVPELVAIVKYVEEHPNATVGELVAALSEGDAQKASMVKSRLAWFLEKGHLIGYAVSGNDSEVILALPAQYPLFRAPGQRKAAAAEKKPATEEVKAEEAKTEAPAEVAEEVKAEVPAEEVKAEVEAPVAEEVPAAVEEVKAEAPVAEEAPAEVAEEVKAEVPVEEVKAEVEAPAAVEEVKAEEPSAEIEKTEEAK